MIDQVKTVGHEYGMGQAEFKIVCNADDVNLMVENENNM